MTRGYSLGTVRDGDLKRGLTSPLPLGAVTFEANALYLSAPAVYIHDGKGGLQVPEVRRPMDMIRALPAYHEPAYPRTMSMPHRYLEPHEYLTEGLYPPRVGLFKREAMIAGELHLHVLDWALGFSVHKIVEKHRECFGHIPDPVPFRTFAFWFQEGLVRTGKYDVVPLTMRVGSAYIVGTAYEIVNGYVNAETSGVNWADFNQMHPHWRLVERTDARFRHVSYMDEFEAAEGPEPEPENTASTGPALEAGKPAPLRKRWLRMTHVSKNHAFKSGRVYTAQEVVTGAWLVHDENGAPWDLPEFPHLDGGLNWEWCLGQIPLPVEFAHLKPGWTIVDAKGEYLFVDEDNMLLVPYAPEGYQIRLPHKEVRPCVRLEAEILDLPYYPRPGDMITWPTGAVTVVTSRDDASGEWFDIPRRGEPIRSRHCDPLDLGPGGCKVGVWRPEIGDLVIQDDMELFVTTQTSDGPMGMSTVNGTQYMIRTKARLVRGADNSGKGLSPAGIGRRVDQCGRSVTDASLAADALVMRRARFMAYLGRYGRDCVNRAFAEGRGAQAIDEGWPGLSAEIRDAYIQVAKHFVDWMR